MAATEPYTLPRGNCCCNYEVIAPGVADGKLIHIPVPAYLIHLDDGSLALVNTGMNRAHLAYPGHTWGGPPFADLLVPDMLENFLYVFKGARSAPVRHDR